MWRAFCVITLVVTQSVSAASIVFSDDDKTLKQSIVSGWQACGEVTWCEDELIYYRDSFIAEARVDETQVHIELLAQYSAHRLSQVQLGLRKDGFEIIKATIGQQSLDVNTLLTGFSRLEADKILILFINRFSQSTPRVLIWQAGQRQLELISDGEIIILHYHHDAQD
ncbi:hypothetical protein [Vibrio salilacus]|uniref:hypothetical protein n=1 Tax=Vibrio salilacus TaxID=1323749 RepID=UPI000C29D69C|nr:hypothetical protein [Vibrio salilacus]